MPAHTCSNTAYNERMFVAVDVCTYTLVVIISVKL